MKKNKTYCCYCGSLVSNRMIDNKLRDCCDTCGAVFYENPLPVASSIVVNDKREVLLVKRKKDPYKDMWCLPIGFAEADEKVSQAALRELEEESGLTGEIVRLIDVDTIDNYFYGSLAIVTYEVKTTGGYLSPGDDAMDAAYFPVSSLPPLAWTSNEKAMDIYRKIYKDTWAMIDSFKQLFPRSDPKSGIAAAVQSPGAYLSNILIKLLDMDMDDISADWIKAVLHNITTLEAHSEELVSLNRRVLYDVRSWLKGSEIDFNGYIEIGRNLKSQCARLPDILTALALSRRSIWMHVIKKRILSTPLEIYSTLELNNRIIFFYDRVNFYITEGYCSL